MTQQDKKPKGYRERWGDRSTWKKGAWPEQVPNTNPDPNPDPNPETVMTCCTCTSRHVSTQPASVQIRVQPPVQVIDDIEDLFQGEVGYEVQTFAETLLSLQATQANTPPELPIQRVASSGSLVTNPPTSPHRLVATVDIDYLGRAGPTDTLPPSLRRMEYRPAANVGKRLHRLQLPDAGQRGEVQHHRKDGGDRRDGTSRRSVSRGHHGGTCGRHLTLPIVQLHR